MKNYLLDTHPLLWWLLKPKKLSKKILKLLEDNNNVFYISVMTILEIQYLTEIGKIKADISEILSYIKVTENMYILHFDEMVLAEGVRLISTRDPFDRIIFATALAYDLKIVTKDSWMHDQHSKIVIW